ncbi:MAG TPA: glycoside hydrolase family 3 C-terminal domain-containing protein [Acidisarcina sp.]|nr:glycoside hydrolase family 3 C-terminal domain-containing protein [Acidisarcina sp.]
MGDCNPQAAATGVVSSLGLAASFDVAQARAYGDLVGREAINVGVHEVEGPGMDMSRVQQGGRNFEYLGEDPILAGTLAIPYIRAMQKHGIIGMSKHYVANDQETNRFTSNEIISDRVLHEINLLPFEMSVKDGDVASIMCAYPLVNGTYNCESAPLMNDVLRNQWGFKGYVQSDFFAAHSTAPSMLAGMDLEMPSGNYYTSSNINAALAANAITIANIDTALNRRYAQMFRMGQFDRPITLTPIDAAGDGLIARKIAEDSVVLLKNANRLLPLSTKNLRKIALIGQSTYTSAVVNGGGGSSRVLPLYTVTPLQGLQNVLTQLGSTATVTMLIAAPDGSNNAAAASLAASSDIAIVMAGVVTSEGKDRPSLSLPDNQDALIASVATANPEHTVLVLKDGDAVLMPWVNQVPAILEAWYPGQEDGNVVADLLFGITNPSGRLPITYPMNASDVPTSTPEQFPGILVGGVPTITYSEGLNNGYRWYESQGITPLFPFGYGLSYTDFRISDLAVSRKVTDGTKPIKMEFSVRNIGNVRGAVVPQVYLGMPTSAAEPPKRLVAFKKVTLDPGEIKEVQVCIDPNATSHPLGYWESLTQNWVIADGAYKIYVANSSADTVLSDSIVVRKKTNSQENTGSDDKSDAAGESCHDQQPD